MIFIQENVLDMSAKYFLQASKYIMPNDWKLRPKVWKTLFFARYDNSLLRIHIQHQRSRI